LEAFYNFVKKLADAFDKVGLDYAFTGALAASFYGVPRTTTDVDVIIAVTNQTDLKRKIASLTRHALHARSANSLLAMYIHACYIVL
jgi:hypothetical protein